MRNNFNKTPAEKATTYLDHAIAEIGKMEFLKQRVRASACNGKKDDDKDERRYRTDKPRGPGDRRKPIPSRLQQVSLCSPLSRKPEPGMFDRMAKNPLKSISESGGTGRRAGLRTLPGLI